MPNLDRSPASRSVRRPGRGAPGRPAEPCCRRPCERRRSRIWFLSMFMSAAYPSPADPTPRIRHGGVRSHDPVGADHDLGRPAPRRPASRPGPRRGPRNWSSRRTSQSPPACSTAAPGSRTSSSWQRRPLNDHLGLRDQRAGVVAVARPRAPDERPRRSGGVRAVRRQPRHGRSGGRRPALPGGRRRRRAPTVINTPSSCDIPDQRARVRLPLGLVGVQQVVVGLPGQDGGELPGRAGGRPQTESEALPDEGRLRWAASRRAAPGRPASGRPPARGRCTRRCARSRPRPGPPAPSAAQALRRRQVRDRPPGASGTPSGTGRR